MHPVIGLTPLWDDDKESFWMLPGYMEGIHEAGGIPVMLPLDANKDELARLAGLCDGFLFTGGHDVSPGLYHEEPLADLVSACPARDAMEGLLLDLVLAADKPVLGICRGIQFINAHLGGTLYQDLPSQHPSETEHHQSPPYEVPVHEVLLTKDTPLHACLQTERLAVNSYHHQAVKTLAPGLHSMAVSTDGLVEALYKPGQRFLWAVQWHPEFSCRVDAASQKIFAAFVAAAR